MTWARPIIDALAKKKGKKSVDSKCSLFSFGCLISAVDCDDELAIAECRGATALAEDSRWHSSRGNRSTLTRPKYTCICLCTWHHWEERIRVGHNADSPTKDTVAKDRLQKREKVVAKSWALYRDSHPFEQRPSIRNFYELSTRLADVRRN